MVMFCLNYTKQYILKTTLSCCDIMLIIFSHFFNGGETGVRGGQPCDDIATDLQELEEVLGLLSVSVFLFSCQGVIGNQQRVGPSSW